MKAKQTLFPGNHSQTQTAVHSSRTLMSSLDGAYTKQSSLEAILINGTFLQAMAEHAGDVTSKCI